MNGADASPRVLVAESDPRSLEALRLVLEADGYDVVEARDGLAALAAFEAGPVPVVVTGARLPGLDVLALLEGLRRRAEDVVVVITTADGETATAVRAMKAGAFALLPWPCSREVVETTIRRGLEYALLREEVRALRTRLGGGAKEILCRTPEMKRAVEVADRVAIADASVLLEGESGSGKDLLARRIHALSRRAGPFVAVNCGALPSELLADELFGHVKGAYRGATAGRKGKLLQADGGTILLDEITDLPSELQVRLLRVVQEGLVDVTGSDQPAPIDVRIVAATTRDLREAVIGGRVRQDLYFRLNVVPIQIPPLRERRDDILLLADHFLRLYGDGEPWSFPPEAVRRLESYSWPGNVRELENTCQRMALLAEDRTLRIDLLPEEIGGPSPGTRAELGPARIELPAEGASLPELERAIIVRALEMNGNNQSAAARFLRIPRHVLLYRIEKFDIPVRARRR